MGLFDSLKAKIKNVTKSSREKTREQYASKSLQELTDIIGSGLKDNKICTTVAEKVGLVDAYLEQLVCSDVLEGGFGFRDSALAREIVAEGGHFAGSIYDFGTHKYYSKALGTVIRNYRLEFLKNYLVAGNTKVFRGEWFQVLFTYPDKYREAVPGGFDADGINYYLEKEDLKNPECHIYDPWVYQGTDEEFILFKLKCAIAFCDFHYAKNNGCYFNGDSSERYLCFSDLKDSGCKSKSELAQYLDDCQVED